LHLLFAGLCILIAWVFSCNGAAAANDPQTWALVPMKEEQTIEQIKPGIFKRAYSGSKELISTLTKFELGYAIGFAATGLCISLCFIALFLLMLFIGSK